MADVTKEKSVSSPPRPVHQLLGLHLVFWQVRFWDLIVTLAYIPLVRFPFTFRQEQYKQPLQALRICHLGGTVWYFSSPCVCQVASLGWVTWLRWAKHCPHLDHHPSIEGFLQALCDCVTWWVGGHCTHTLGSWMQLHSQDFRGKAFLKWMVLLFHFSRIAKRRWLESTHERLH